MPNLPIATIQDSAPVKRSNRPLTQFACQMMGDFLLGKIEPKKYIIHNTTVNCIESKTSTTLTVYLFNTQIMTVSLSLPREEPIDVSICVGDKFTDDGFPTRTTIERLNGLLDCLGIHGVIPTGVRIFKDSSQNTFYLGKGDDRIAVGEKYAQNIRLVPDHYRFMVEASDIKLD